MVIPKSSSRDILDSNGSKPRQSMGRRQFLILAASSAGVGLSSGNAVAKREGEKPFEVDNAQLVSVVVEYDAPDWNNQHRDLFISDILRQKEQKLFLNKRRGFELFDNNDLVVRFNREYRTKGKLEKESTKTLPTSYKSAAGEGILSTKNYHSLPQPEIMEKNGNKIKYEYNDVSGVLKPGESELISGESITVITPGDEKEVETSPEVSISNHGRITAFGEKDGTLLPRNPNKEWVKREARWAENNKDNERVEMNEHTILINDNNSKRGK